MWSCSASKRDGHGSPRSFLELSIETQDEVCEVYAVNFDDALLIQPVRPRGLRKRQFEFTFDRK